MQCFSQMQLRHTLPFLSPLGRAEDDNFASPIFSRHHHTVTMARALSSSCSLRPSLKLPSLKIGFQLPALTPFSK